MKKIFKYDEVPILILFYKRYRIAKRLILILKKIKPKNIYISFDGPRTKDEESDVFNTRDIIKYIDWKCNLKIKVNDENLGCRSAVTSALDWFFKYNEMGIILEEDCVPEHTFFKFSFEMLNKYKNNNKVISIGAQHFPGHYHKIDSSYFFSMHFHCWGWATWRRSWLIFDRDMNDWETLRNTRWLYKLGGNNLLFAYYWRKIFDNCKANKIDSWAYRFLFNVWSKNKLTILPSVNLVKNIGFGKNATHTTKGNYHTENLVLKKMNFPLRHPNIVVADDFSDKWTHTNIFEITMFKIIKSEIYQFIKFLFQKYRL